MNLSTFLLPCRLWKEFPHYHQQPLDVKQELFALCGPAIAGQAIEPFAQLMETAYIGRLGMYLQNFQYSVVLVFILQINALPFIITLLS